MNLVRQTAAKELVLVGGNRFHPGDDLETDLYLSDLTFWGEWLEKVSRRQLEIEEDELALELESVSVRTYGDLVLLFYRLRRARKV